MTEDEAQEYDRYDLALVAVFDIIDRVTAGGRYVADLDELQGAVEKIREVLEKLP